MGKICFLRRLSTNILDIYLQDSGNTNVTERHKNKTLRGMMYAATANDEHLVPKIKIVTVKPLFFTKWFSRIYCESTGYYSRK